MLRHKFIPAIALPILPRLCVCSLSRGRPGSPQIAGLLKVMARNIQASSKLRPMATRLTLVAFVLLCLGLPARALDPVVPFQADLERLSEILGALHYLRAICGSNEGQKWRNEMQALVDTEAPNGDRRSRMIANFNRGYRGFQQAYRTCTPAADLAIRRYLDEGVKISREVTARYAN
jgi:uncharacterized protein (TIGR02301 family)